MKIQRWKMIVASSLLFFIGCAGLKVVKPEDQNKNAGTMALDLSSGKPKIVETYTCKIVASNGNRVSAIGKTEDEAKNEALAKCRDQTVVSFCEEKNVKCDRN